ncbi:MAG: hypothetical protein QGF09_15640 [Rhodospirillales bacterium]|nr:hypothetical protein [Rhodospirillales bacterium]
MNPSHDNPHLDGFPRAAFYVETCMQVVCVCAVAVLLGFIFNAADFIAADESLELVRSRGVKVGFFLVIPLIAAFSVTGLRLGFGRLARDSMISATSAGAARYIWGLTVFITLVLILVAGFAAHGGFADIDFRT